MVRKQDRERRLLAELEGLAAQLGVEVVREPLEESRSGLCRIYDRHLLFVEASLPLLEQIDVFAAALASFPLEDLYLRPQVRELIERTRVRRAPTTCS